MIVPGLALAVSLIAFAAIGVVVTIILAPVTRWLLHGPERSSVTLGTLRLLPTLVAGLVVGLWVLPGFLWLEPRDSGERFTPALAALTCVAALAVGAGLLRGAGALAATRSIVRRWRRGASPITAAGLAAPALAVDDPFPVIAVAGILRPRLYVARRVLGVLTADELAAVLQHEAAHLRRRDNLMRLVLRSCPDLHVWGGFGDALERAWSAATERESDAAVGPDGRRLDLASALVKVARLAEGRSMTVAGAAAFHGGEPIGERVRRLLQPPPSPPAEPRRRRIGMTLAIAGFMLLLAGLQPAILRDVYGVTESFVRMLQ